MLRDPAQAALALEALMLLCRSWPSSTHLACATAAAAATLLLLLLLLPYLRNDLCVERLFNLFGAVL